jgi:hypothetical protein
MRDVRSSLKAVAIQACWYGALIREGWSFTPSQNYRLSSDFTSTCASYHAQPHSLGGEARVEYEDKSTVAFHPGFEIYLHTLTYVTSSRLRIFLETEHMLATTNSCL